MAEQSAYRIVARASRVPGSPFKLRRYARLISGRPVEEALDLLSVMPSPNARKVWKVVQQARANAENNFQQDAADLVISQIWVNEGPRLKRFQPRARGRAFPILKRTSHITLELGPKPVKESN
ncbi:MAG: 50S ribosomal protein L22 [bacterium]|nr:50S ribosomal protein L22 [bacterium]